MKYLTTTYENFGVIVEVDSLPEYCEVIGDIDIISFIRRQKPHLVSFDGERAYTRHPEELARHIPDTRKNLQNLLTILKAVTKTIGLFLYQQGRRSYRNPIRKIIQSCKSLSKAKGTHFRTSGGGSGM